MNLRCSILVMLVMCFTAVVGSAQPPEDGRGQQKPREGRGGERSESGMSGSGQLSRYMILDRNKDETFTRDEYEGSRFRPMFERADANGDKTVTKAELTAFLGTAASPGGDGRGEGERRERGMSSPRGPMPRPGTILPEFLMNDLQLNEEQRAAIAKLQQTVDAELKRILTADQHQKLAQPAAGMRGRGGEGSEGGQRRQEVPKGEGGGGRGRRPEGERPAAGPVEGAGAQ